jgi:hypothetical protein
MAGVRIITRLMRRAYREFLSAQPLKCLCLAYTAGLNILKEICVVHGDGWEITTAGAA